MSGYILWYRKAESNPVLEDDKFDRLHAWLWMIERANFKRVTITYNGKKRQLKRGQFITSTRRLSAVFNWSKRKVSQFLDDLEANGMIQREKCGSGTLLTIEKYTTFQDGRDTNAPTNEPTDAYANAPTNAYANEPQYKEYKGKKERTNRSPDSLGGDRGSGIGVNYGDPRYTEMELGEPDVL